MYTFMCLVQVAWTSRCTGPVPQPPGWGPGGTCLQQGCWWYESACSRESSSHEHRGCGTWPYGCRATAAQTGGPGTRYDSHRGQAQGIAPVSTDDSKMSLAFFITLVHIDFPASTTYPAFGCENSFLWSVMFICRVAYCEHGAQMSWW